MATRFRLFVVACAVGLALPQLVGAAVPNGVATHLLGVRMIRAEVLVKADGLRDYRLDRGRVAKPWNASTITIREGDGTSAPVPISATATVTLNGKPANLTDVRKGMVVAISRLGDAPADAVYANRPRLGAPRLPLAYQSLLLGAKLVRAEIAFKTADGVLHDYRLDHGVVRTTKSRTLTLAEGDGQVAAVPVAADGRIVLNGRTVLYSAIRRGADATTIRDGASPAHAVYAFRKR